MTTAALLPLVVAAPVAAQGSGWVSFYEVFDGEEYDCAAFSEEDRLGTVVPGQCFSYNGWDYTDVSSYTAGLKLCSDGQTQTAVVSYDVWLTAYSDDSSLLFSVEDLSWYYEGAVIEEPVYQISDRIVFSAVSAPEILLDLTMEGNSSSYSEIIVCLTTIDGGETAQVTYGDAGNMLATLFVAGLLTLQVLIRVTEKLVEQ